ncbi:hypothetical protein BSK47_17260 [Paenibacillus odorifer]|uniref:Uncharacterized protein n=1 Tax=Paenibacillus odorifer TaxID=189426 RepID=A0AB36JA80_9BACL|nr:hypothetical protein BSK47_17260 [Paenibacillus odorifer]
MNYNLWQNQYIRLACGQDQVIVSWTMLGMCGALIFNGAALYLKTKDKMAVLSSIVGIVLLIVSLTQFPF